MVECEKRAVLIGAGELCGEVMERRENDIIFALDGGLLYCEENGITPDYIIGDFDSLPEEKAVLLTNYPQECIRRLPCEKDDTDMLAAIKLAIENGIEDFAILGGLGGRLSHTIANIQCLMYLKELGMTGVLLGKDTKAILLKNETYTFDGEDSGYVSVFAYSQNASGITLKNLKYELEDAVLTSSFPLGVSNEFVPGKTAEITVKDGMLLVVMDV